MGFVGKIRRKTKSDNSVNGNGNNDSECETQSNALIDAEDLVSRYSLQELAESAENYFGRLTHHWYHLAKPFASPEETPDLLGSTSALMRAAEIVKGDRVLDFAAGSCWMSRMLAQMGCDVVATDISPSALAIGQQLLSKMPLIEPSGRLEFRQFNGRTIDLPSESIDVIVCSDAFHHIPNREEVLSEMARVLVPGGLAILSEPGPNHSKSAQSQYEMRNYTVVERDIVVEDVETLALQAGFESMEVAVYNPVPYFFAVSDFNVVLHEDDARLAATTRPYLSNHRLMRLRAKGVRTRDSRSRAGLNASISVETKNRMVTAVITNTGSVDWLPSGSHPGAVNLGIHLLGSDETCLDLDFQRVDLGGQPIEPGQTVSVTFELKNTSLSDFFEIDLVSEHVTWFSVVGVPTVKLRL